MSKGSITLLAVTFSIFTYAQVGINTINPQKTLDIEGSLRLSQNPTTNIPDVLIGGSQVPLYGNKMDGSVQYSPTGYTKVVGGFRPGATSVITTLPITNTIARIRFICHVDSSNESNNSNVGSYTYGDFTVVGTGSSNPIRIVDVQLKGYDGAAKTPTTSTNTALSWTNMSNVNHGNTTVTLNQTTGEMTISNTTNGEIFSYFFEILGGI
ncbi:hypothetical protein [Chryseobacterium sp. SIMBA_029]|uniref:hypothetical protein n=1 Tax=Chryseobacterium sp. SIMBA_029 TaxID=3085772 RepID=UPI00397CF6B5